MPEFILNIANSSAAYDALDEFAIGYIEAMFFTELSHGDDCSMANWFSDETQEALGEGQLDGCLPSDCGVEHLHESAIARIAGVCADFQAKAAALLGLAYARGYSAEQAGRDLWFTSQGHGVGYWDRKELEHDSDEWAALKIPLNQWSAEMSKRHAELKAESLGEQLSALARHDERNVWFGDHVENGNAPWVYYQ